MANNAATSFRLLEVLKGWFPIERGAIWIKPKTEKIIARVNLRKAWNERGKSKLQSQTKMNTYQETMADMNWHQNSD